MKVAHAVLLVQGDAAESFVSRKLLARGRRARFVLRVVPDAEQARRELEGARFDLVVVREGLPGGGEGGLLVELARRGLGARVLFIHEPRDARWAHGGGLVEQARALELGALISAGELDDELLERSVDALLERAGLVEGRREAEERFDLAMRASIAGLFEWDIARGCFHGSERFLEILQLPTAVSARARELWWERVHPDDLEALEQALDDHLAGRAASFECAHRVRSEEGAWLSLQVRGETSFDAEGRPARLVGSILDVSASLEAERRLARQALVDDLSGLPNRASFVSALERAVARSTRRSGARFALLFLDLDRFKAINDTLGHAVGDSLLVEVAERLRESTRPEDHVARFGGDEFAILVEGIGGADDALRVAHRVQRTLDRPFRVHGNELHTSASIGIALSNEGYELPGDLLRNADTAMYRAKEAGGGRHEIFRADMHRKALAAMRLEMELRRALLREELRVVYQPLVELEARRVVGFEALVRWQHPERGAVSPGEFIPVAERSGLIHELGASVLRAATNELARWRAESKCPSWLGVSVNVSGAQLLRPGFRAHVLDALAESRLPPELLRLELTENVLLENVEAARSVLTGLRELGVRIHLDDFGTGYSSLGYLRQFPIDALKMDGSFLADAERNPRGWSFVETIVGLARGLGLSLIVEGVETEAQRERLLELGCVHAQGYLFSRPLEAEAAGRLVGEGDARLSALCEGRGGGFRPGAAR